MAHINSTQDSVEDQIGQRKEERGSLSTGIEKATKRMHNRLICPLCEMLLVDPVTTIRCGHTVCLSCYHEWAQYHGMKRSPYRCALCDTPFVHLAPNWAVNDLIRFHLDTLEENQTPGWFGPSAIVRNHYDGRVAEWNARKAGIREIFTHPEELVTLVPLDPVKPDA